jgi:TolA-binding protein
MVMTEQHFVVKKFFITLVSRARQLFERANKDAADWSTAIMAPVFAQIREHKVMMDQRVSNMQKIHKNLDSLNGRINQLISTKENLEGQQKINQEMLAHIKNPGLQAGRIDGSVVANDDDDDPPTDRLAITGGVA